MSRPRLRLVKSSPAELGEIAEPGTLGRLELRAVTDEHGTLEHAGDYRYVGLVRGLHAFAPASCEPVLFLARREVLAFRPKP